MAFALLAYGRVNRLTDWRGTQVYPAMIELRNVTHLKCVDQYECLAIIRALRRTPLFERRPSRRS